MEYELATVPSEKSKRPLTRSWADPTRQKVNKQATAHKNITNLSKQLIKEFTSPTSGTSYWKQNVIKKLPVEMQETLKSLGEDEVDFPDLFVSLLFSF